MTKAELRPILDNDFQEASLSEEDITVLEWYNMIKKLKGNKKLKVIFIILVITFIYFISQKIIIKTYDNTYKLSLYETSSIKLYLKIKYPLKAFKILYVTNEERFSIENGNISDGILTNKIILVGVKNKPGNEFQIGII